MSDQSPILLHPARVAALVWAGSAVLLGCCAPFMVMEGFDLLVFLGTGLPYCLFLALFAVGFTLAIRRRFTWIWLLSGAIPWFGYFGFWLWLRLAPSEIVLRRLPFVAQGLLGVIGVWLATGCVVAGWGWLNYIRWRRAEVVPNPSACT